MPLFVSVTGYPFFSLIYRCWQIGGFSFGGTFFSRFLTHILPIVRPFRFKFFGGSALRFDFFIAPHIRHVEIVTRNLRVLIDAILHRSAYCYVLYGLAFMPKKPQAVLL